MRVRQIPLKGYLTSHWAYLVAQAAESTIKFQVTEFQKQAMEQPVNRQEYWAHEDEIAWRKGVQLVALGAGLACFFFILGAGPLSGIGLLVLCIGLGKLYIGKRAKKNREENTEE